MRIASGDRVARVGPLVAMLLLACGPELRSGDDAEADEAFLAEAEELVDEVCTQTETCEDWWNDRPQLVEYFFNVFEYTSECHAPLLDGTERIYFGDRCTDPQTMLALFECIAAVDCPSYFDKEELCAAEIAAVEAALCNPF